jgi:hypothetical protein
VQDSNDDGFWRGLVKKRAETSWAGNAKLKVEMKHEQSAGRKVLHHHRIGAI